MLHKLFYICQCQELVLSVRELYFWPDLKQINQPGHQLTDTGWVFYNIIIYLYDKKFVFTKLIFSLYKKDLFTLSFYY